MRVVALVARTVEALFPARRAVDHAQLDDWRWVDGAAVRWKREVFGREKHRDGGGGARSEASRVARGGVGVTMKSGAGEDSGYGERGSQGAVVSPRRVYLEPKDAPLPPTPHIRACFGSWRTVSSYSLVSYGRISIVFTTGFGQGRREQRQV